MAEGLGVSLTVQEKDKIAHWYLKPHGDYRSSNSLEVTANEYTSQGLELDFTGICWGGDFVREAGKRVGALEGFKKQHGKMYMIWIPSDISSINTASF